jgi:hypothetical protein
MIRLKEGLNRYKFIFEAVKLLRKSKMMENQVRKYEDGYRIMPDSAKDMKGWEKASLATFSGEGWQEFVISFAAGQFGCR